MALSSYARILFDTKSTAPSHGPKPWKQAIAEYDEAKKLDKANKDTARGKERRIAHASASIVRLRNLDPLAQKSTREEKLSVRNQLPPTAITTRRGQGNPTVGLFGSPSRFKQTPDARTMTKVKVSPR